MASPAVKRAQEKVEALWAGKTMFLQVVRTVLQHYGISEKGTDVHALARETWAQLQKREVPGRLAKEADSGVPADVTAVSLIREATARVLLR